MQEWITVGSARTASGNEFLLGHRGNDWSVRVDGRMLMSSRMHYSEIMLAERAIDRVNEAATVLVGGLGLGFTLRATLDRVEDDAVVTVAELVPELVEWNRTHLAELNARPLEDPRCEVVVGDVYDLLKSSVARFDVILLDIDNGPQGLTQAKNQRLYMDAGVRACHAALTRGGVLGVWSVGTNAKYRKRLEHFGFVVDVQRVPAREGSRGTHVIFLAQRA